MMCGWCMTGHHKECQPKIEKWYHGFTGAGRNRKAVVVPTGEYHICDCKHTKTKKTVKKKAKTK